MSVRVSRDVMRCLSSLECFELLRLSSEAKGRGGIYGVEELVCIIINLEYRIAKWTKIMVLS